MVNAKNSFGGYVGQQAYIGELAPTTGFTLIQLDNPGFEGEAWPAILRCKRNGMVMQ
jgi:hypothetical protein